ncbi:Carbonic anhydrase [Mycena venus]|uniref:Carbonic anhydrase n=1 Tax=Mycena venus TaxID=2733690 RepID=A0A8H6Y5A4_9AGAR|nr:Carbonic anhydrase [Mycena venus]
MAYLRILRATFAIASFVSVSANCGHDTSIYPRDHAQVHQSAFGYSGTRGPVDWAGLSPANCACSEGKQQSPIVLTANTTIAADAPNVTISSVDRATLVNLGTTLEVVMNGTLIFNKTDYQLKQFHLHTPSEHRIEEEYFPMEMHMVHQSNIDGSLLVAAVLFQLSENGTTTQLITSMALNLANVTDPGTNTTTGPLDFTSVVHAVMSGPLYQYSGSLTTPPCTQGVTFLVLANPLSLDVQTYNNLKKILKFNARYTQNTLGENNLLAVAYTNSQTCHRA